MVLDSHYIVLTIVLMALHPHQLKGKVCSKITTEDVLKLKVMASAYLARHPYFRKNVLQRLPDYYYNPPKLQPRPYLASVRRCAKGPKSFVGLGKDIQDALPMINSIHPVKCTGLFITNQWILVPAHCLFLDRIKVNRFLILSRGYLSHSHYIPICHYKYEFGHEWDVALMRAHTSNGLILPACAPDIWTDVPPIGATCIVTSWEGTKYKGSLTYVNVTIKKFDDEFIYIKSNSPDEPLKEREGFLLCPVSGEYTVVGMASEQKKYRIKKRNIMYTRISNLMIWIRDKLKHSSPVLSQLDLMQPVDPIYAAGKL